MIEKIKQQKGIIQIPILIGILVLISVAVVGTVEVVKHRQEIKSAIINIPSAILESEQNIIEGSIDEIESVSTPKTMSTTDTTDDLEKEVKNPKQKSPEIVYKDVIKEIIKEVPVFISASESQSEPEPEAEIKEEKVEPIFCSDKSDCPKCQYCDSGECVNYCRGDNTTSCGCEICVNCNESDGCFMHGYRDYYCKDMSCVYDEDDCSDCSCSCGGYNVEENNKNGNCSDDKDNDCDGAVDWDDLECISVGSATITWGDNNPFPSTQKIGTTDFIVSSIKITADSVEDIIIEKIIWTQNGSADVSSIKNLDLVNFNTGEILETIEQPDNQAITFYPNLKIDKGESVILDLRLDVNGYGHTISLDIDKKADIIIKGESSRFSIMPDFLNKSSFNANNTTMDGSYGKIIISPASISVSEISSFQQEREASDQILGAFDFIVQGEDIFIKEFKLKFNIVTNNGDLSSEIKSTSLTSNDSTVTSGGNADISNNYTIIWNDTISAFIGIGKTTFIVRGRPFFFSSGDTIQVEITPTTDIFAKGASTGETVTMIKPTTAVTSVVQVIE